MWTFSCAVPFDSCLVPPWFHLRFPLVVPLPLGFSIGQGGHTGKMPGVALTFVVLQQEKVPLSRARSGPFARDAGCQLAGVEAEETPYHWLHGGYTDHQKKNPAII